MNPKISVIVPVYKAEKYLHRCVDSILAQTFTDFEVLLIDDGSPDRSGEICDEYAKKDSRVRVFHKENGGVSSARNMGIKRAIGEWIIYIDSDDYFFSNALESLYMNANDMKVKVCTGNFFSENAGLRRTECLSNSKEIIKNNFKSYFFRKIVPRAGTTLFHSSVIKTNLFDENLWRYEDIKSLLDILRTNKVAFVPEYIMCYNNDQRGLSIKCKIIERDFLFSLDFKNKSFWERIILAELLNQARVVYPEHLAQLKTQHKQEWYLIYLVAIFRILRKLIIKTL